MQSEKSANLRPTDNWLLSKWEGKCIVDLLDNKSWNKEILIEDVATFKKIGIEGTIKEIATSFNQSFIALKLPLKAEPWENSKIKDRFKLPTEAKPNSTIIIRHTKVFDAKKYDSSDKEKPLTEDYQNLLKRAYSTRKLSKVTMGKLPPSFTKIKPTQIAIIDSKKTKSEEEKQKKIRIDELKLIRDQKTRGS